MDLIELEELREDVANLLRSNGWLFVIRPVIEKRCTDIQRKLAIDKRLTIEDIRGLQAQYQVLISIIDEPLKFFLGMDT